MTVIEDKKLIIIVIRGKINNNRDKQKSITYLSEILYKFIYLLSSMSL